MSGRYTQSGSSYLVFLFTAVNNARKNVSKIVQLNIDIFSLLNPKYFPFSLFWAEFVLIRTQHRT